PIHFIPNHGQWEDAVIARANINSGWFWMDKTGFTYLLYDGKKVGEQHTKNYKTKPAPVDAQVIKVVFEGADFSQTPYFEKPTSEYYNFFLGNDPVKWQNGIYGYHKIYFSNVYPEIDFVLYTNGDALKYDFIVKPGGDPNQIKVHYLGQNNLALGKTGDLKLQTLFGNITEKAPIVYQQNQYSKKKINSSYKLVENRLTFNIKNFDKTKNLVIDPELIFSTFSGSRADNFGYTATYDQAANGYSGGTVFAAEFPVTPGVFQATFGGGSIADLGRDIGILKYSKDGSKLLFCTFLGGKRNEDPHSMVVNNKDELVVFGNSFSKTFPVTSGAFDTTHNGENDIIVARISPDGKQLLSSTFVGGSSNDALNGYFSSTPYQSELAYNYGDTYRGEVISDSAGNIYIATVTSSSNFPVKNGHQQTFGGGIQDGCLIKLSSDLSQIVWSTYLGGENDDALYSLFLGKNGSVYTCGGTISPDFLTPTIPGAYPVQQSKDSGDGFVACLSADGNTLLYSTYFGSKGYDQCYFVQLDKEENVFVTGQSVHGNELPVTPGLYTNPSAGQFIAKFSSQLDTVLLCTTFGSNSGIPDLSPSAFLVDDCGQVYFSGWGGGTNSPEFGGHGGSTKNFPLTEDAIQSTTDGSDFYLAVFTHDLKKLVYATYFGGNVSEEHVDGGTSRFDKRGVVYQSVCAGCGGFSDFPTTFDAWSRINRGVRPDDSTDGGCNNALFKMDVNTHPAFTYIVDACALTVQFTKDTLSSNASVRWDFGDNQYADQLNPSHKYQKPGLYTVTVFTNYGTDCEDTSTLIVDVASLRGKTLSIYNVITPNNDGLNEVFYIPELDAICEEYELKIYNRWGEYMYNKKGKNLKWFGTNLKGKDAVEGTYFYLLHSPTFGEFKGTITVLR
ncbi:MAG: DUF7948 domain-containing protein, partial [Bacteroidia bacterium]